LRRASLVPSSRNPALTDPANRPDSNMWQRHSLRPVPNPDPTAPAQPSRCRPFHVATTHDGRKAYVTLSGKEIQPGTEVVVLDVLRCKEIGRITVGFHPCGLAIHPTGRWIIVANRYSNFLSVIDVRTDAVISEIPIPFYCEDLVFSPEGAIAYVSNFWKNQVLVVDLTDEGQRLTGRVRQLGFNREEFFGEVRSVTNSWTLCDACGWHEQVPKQVTVQKCRRCGHSPVRHTEQTIDERIRVGLSAILRAGCGTSGCHLYRTGDFYAGPNDAELFRSTVVHSFPGDPDGSPLLRAVISVRDGGWADSVDGRHHAGDIVFKDLSSNPDYARLRKWIAEGVAGPGISVGQKPRDLAVSSDGTTLYVANTGSADVSVIDLIELRETRRIFTRSAVSDVLSIDGHLVLASLGFGSGHPKTHDAGRESTDRDHPQAEFTLFRDLATGKPLPLVEQQPLGEFDNVDGTAQEKFRDITNDIILLDPSVENVAAYRATDRFTRYTSDSYEALAGDKKGDVAAALMKVVGAFPEQIAQRGDHIYVTMSGTFQVQEWHLNMATSPEVRLVPGRVFTTGFKPTGIAVAEKTLVVANHLGESITFIDLDDGHTTHLSLSREPEPFPANDFERGEFFVQTSVFSVDQDQSCVHCHFRDTSDGRRWSVSQVMGQSRDGQERTGGSREVPDLRNLVHEVPFFVEGTLTMDEPLTMMMEHNPLVDFQGQTPSGDFSQIVVSPEEMEKYNNSADAIVVATGKKWDENRVQLADLIKRREVHFGQISEKYLGRRYSFRDFQRFIGAYQGGEPRLLPNPVDPDDVMVRHGRALFTGPKVGCAGCHPAPTFTDKLHVYNQNKSFPPLVSPARRDNIHTLISADRIDYLNGFERSWDLDDNGRVESHEGFFVAPSLRGIWARPPKFLHHGHAISMREVVCTPDHPALRRFTQPRHDAPRPNGREIGLNELNGLLDTHGTTSHLSVWDIECLVAYIHSIE
ncbi:MAG: hypothetical protein ACC628_21995, partial [Pirellulaceae bacterium]